VARRIVIELPRTGLEGTRAAILSLNASKVRGNKFPGRAEI
jgi:hypothetical protein